MKNVPLSSGFYYMGAIGLSFVVTRHDGQTKIHVEPTASFRRATRILAPFVFVSAGALISGSIKAGRATQPQEALDFSTVTSATVFSNRSEVGTDLAVELGFPPLGGTVAVFSGEQTRYRLTPASIMALLRSTYNTLKRMTIDRKCHALFASIRLGS